MELVSTMGSGQLGRELELQTLVMEIEKSFGESVEIKFTSDSIVTIRLEGEGPAYTVFRTGTFQVRGAETEDQLFEAARRFRDMLSNIGVEMLDYEFDHVTSVLMEDFEQEVHLEALTLALGMEHTEYEPEQFPGLIYRPPEFEVTLLIFSSGKVIIGGTTERDEASAAIDHLREELVAVKNI